MGAMQQAMFLLNQGGSGSPVTVGGVAVTVEAAPVVVA